jgi:hypothetical protein
MVFEDQDEHPSQWSAITSIATKFGVSAEALHEGEERELIRGPLKLLPMELRNALRESATAHRRAR